MDTHECPIIYSWYKIRRDIIFCYETKFFMTSSSTYIRNTMKTEGYNDHPITFEHACTWMLIIIKNLKSQQDFLANIGWL